MCFFAMGRSEGAAASGGSFNAGIQERGLAPGIMHRPVRHRDRQWRFLSALFLDSSSAVKQGGILSATGAGSLTVGTSNVNVANTQDDPSSASDNFARGIFASGAGSNITLPIGVGRSDTTNDACDSGQSDNQQVGAYGTWIFDNGFYVEPAAVLR